MSTELVLGTAQLGNAYGVNNTVGKLTYGQACEVLDVAVEEGVTLVDTAEAYGDSERFIGEYRRACGDAFGVCTKLSGNVKGGEDVRLQVRKRVQASAARLFAPTLFIYYLHSFEMCRNGALLDALVQERAEGALEHVGVSVYEPSELEFLLDNAAGAVDAVQIPFNVFNCYRWLEDGLLERASRAGVTLLARSIYLQGMVFKRLDDPLVIKLGLADAIGEYRKLSDETRLDPAALATSFACAFHEINFVILGSETPEQVKRNAALVSGANALGKSVTESIVSMSEALDDSQIDPRCWSK